MMAARRYALGAGVAGLLGAGLGWALEPRDFALGWVAAVSAWLAWPLGSMALLMVHALAGGRWGVALGPALRAGTATLPLLLPALVPLLLLAPTIYPWLHTPPANAWYLNPGFATGRLAAYLVVWAALALLTLRGAHIAAAGLPLLAITLTFASIDLSMSLDPAFNSSIYGLLALANAGLTALAAATLLTAAAGDAAARAQVAQLLQGMLVLFLYLDFMQLLIIWESDLAGDAPWYAPRARGAWAVVAVAVVVLHAALPFALLLRPAWQRRRGVLLAVATLLLAGGALRAWWLVLPGRPGAFSWSTPCCLLALAGLAAAMSLSWAARHD